MLSLLHSDIMCTQCYTLAFVLKLNEHISIL